ncbi:hypothetical protein CPB83DRAFT_839689 [Crepidotus variabilis]|uniref:Uncharacterized protein n=1 Tax=Crepidotus variabilis TaxID=179855 RepID=A0A9P6E6I1_9AGAR|nr:hypothetical protein CPB83DRAFT_839689 [Crepidotus variabilis]
MPYHRTRHGYRADVRTILQWGKLETEIRHLTKQLATKYDVPLGRDIMGDENAVVCSAAYLSPEEFKKQLHRTQGWFSVHMARLSWIIAIALASDKENPLTKCPQWMSYLLERSQPEPLLVHSIRSSAAAFSHYEPFVGVFVNILKFNLSHPSLQFLIRNKVPVWYRWTSAEEVEASSSPFLQRYAPLTEQYQQASTTLIANPTPPHLDNISLPYRPDYSDALPGTEDAPSSISSGPGISLAPAEGPSLQKTPDEPWVDLRYDAFFNVWDFCSAWREKTAEEIEADEEDDEARSSVSLTSLFVRVKSQSSTIIFVQ